MSKQRPPYFVPLHRGAGLGPARSRGFALVELIIALSISALIAMYAAAQLTNEVEETLAEGSGEYLRLVAAAAEQHTLLNFDNYANNIDVAGVATDLQPTVAELVTLGRLNGGFPSAVGSLPTRQTARIDITRTNCPGPNCTLLALVCTTTAVNLGTGPTRFDLASTMMSAQNGAGGQSLQNAGTVIRGPALNVPNPVGNVEGVVCGSSTVDTALLQRFLVLNETRNPNFQGPVSIAGATTISNNLTVTGTASITADTSVGTCARILATTGRAGFGCANPNDLPAGYTGGVRTPDVVASGRMVASDNPAAFTGTNGNYAYVGVQAGVAEVRTSGRAAANRLTPLGQYAEGTACAAADEGSIARRLVGTGLVVCQATLWTVMQTRANAGDVCTPNGSMATAGTGVALLCVNGVYVGMDTIIRSATPGQACTTSGATAIDLTSNNELLICRTNLAGGPARYMRMRDMTSHMAFVSATEVTDVSVGASGLVDKPNCNAGALQPATPIIQLIPKAFSSPDGGVTLYAVDIGVRWQVYLRNGAGGVLSGNPNASAVAQIFCYFP